LITVRSPACSAASSGPRMWALWLAGLGHRRRAGVALFAGLCVFAVPLTSVTAQPPMGRPIPSPSLTLEPIEAQVRLGENLSLVAVARGGEAIRFSIDWTIVEGPAAGTLEIETERPEETGISRALFTPAPATNGVVHVTVRLRQFPTAEAIATIRVVTQNR